MKLKLVRQWFTDKSTCGELYIDENPTRFCYTLELPNVDGKPGSCIPQGTYPVAYLHSPRFGRNMPHLLDIPSRSNILIHWGNDEQDTEGCILLGREHTQDFISFSKDTWHSFMERFEPVFAEGVTIEVVGGAKQPESSVDEVDL